jgi:hypothetical protein
MAMVELPEALHPFYACPQPDKRIVLFRGPVDLVDATGAHRYRGGVVWEWLPSPGVYSHAEGKMSAIAAQFVMDQEVLESRPQTPARHVPKQLNALRRSRATGPSSFETSLRLRSFECGDATVPLSYALLHVANFPLLHGRPISWPDGCVASGRLHFEGEGWRITLDQVKGASDLEKKLASNGGFGLTHVARVERVSGNAFTASDLKAVTQAFMYFCWLCAARRAGPVLPVGFDAEDAPVWADWDAPWIDRFEAAETWLDWAHADEAESLFPTFIARFMDPYWRQVLILAIQHFLAAGRPQPLERAIVMAQVLLETVSYSWLLNEVKARTHDSYKDHSAAQNIRKMLTSMGIPIEVPKRLSALRGVRTENGHVADGPHALTLTRNDLVHRKVSTVGINYDVIEDAWRLGAWYADLTVLRLCGFNGMYRSRLQENKWTGAVEPVPWARPMWDGHT